MFGTASVNGTLVRVWDAKTAKIINEMRRGTDPAEICHIAFDEKSRMVAIASSKYTIHVFKIDPESPSSGLLSMATSLIQEG